MGGVWDVAVDSFGLPVCLELGPGQEYICLAVNLNTFIDRIVFAHNQKAESEWVSQLAT